MKYRDIGEPTVRIFALVFDEGDEVVESIEAFARERNVRAARLTGIGGFAEAQLGYFDRASQRYEPIEVHEQVELLALIGDIAVKDGKPALHAHATVGHRGGGVTGGHLLRAIVWPTLELFVDVYPSELRKTQKPAFGIATIDLDSGGLSSPAGKG